MASESGSKVVAVVAPCFPPSNRTAAQRPRLVAQHLKSFGYSPIVFTVQSDAHETEIEPALLELVAPDVEVVRVAALPTKPIRLMGDIALRAMPYLGAALDAFANRRRIDLVYVTTPPNYATITGVRFAARRGIPAVVDFTDPWVQPFLPADWRSLKAILSHLLARLLEPYVARRLAGVVSVAPRYLDHILPRAPHALTAYAPMGFEAADFAAARGRNLPPEILALGYGDARVVTYAGALLPRAVEVFRASIAGLAEAIAADPVACDRMRLVFVGTASGGRLAQWAAEFGIADRVRELPERIGYLDVLTALTQSHAVLVPGSVERHYTPSKIFQALLSGRPVLAALHDQCAAIELARRADGVEVVAFSESTHFDAIKSSMRAAWLKIASTPAVGLVRNLSALPQEQSARESARTIALLFDRCLAQTPR